MTDSIQKEINNTDELQPKRWMKRALELAEKGKGLVQPNPMVGAVLVQDKKKIGEGYHRSHGEAHAEIEALKNADSNVEGATLYLNLEPCCVSGKTPPCTEALIEAGISRVVAAMPDPNPDIHGKGFEELREHGIQVDVGLCKKEALLVNRRFLTFQMKRRSYIVAKWAMSFDGKIATHTGDSKWITSSRARRRARSLRVDEGAVMVGIGTVIEDNPTLLGPDEDGPHPIRIIVDSRLRLPPGYDIVHTTEQTRTIVATVKGANEQKANQLRDQGVEILEVPGNERRVDFDQLTSALAQKGIQSILVEGGGTLLGSAFEQDLIDEVKVFIAPKIIGGEEAVTPVEGKGIQKVKEAPDLKHVRMEWMEPDLLLKALYREPPHIDE